MCPKHRAQRDQALLRLLGEAWAPAYRGVCAGVGVRVERAIGDRRACRGGWVVIWEGDGWEWEST